MDAVEGEYNIFLFICFVITVLLRINALGVYQIFHQVKEAFIRGSVFLKMSIIVKDCITFITFKVLLEVKQVKRKNFFRDLKLHFHKKSV